MTWVGYTNTFLVAVANLLTAAATLIYILRTKKTVNQAQSDVQEIKAVIPTLIEQTAPLPTQRSGPPERPLG